MSEGKVNLQCYLSAADSRGFAIWVIIRYELSSSSSTLVLTRTREKAPKVTPQNWCSVTRPGFTTILTPPLALRSTVFP